MDNIGGNDALDDANLGADGVRSRPNPDDGPSPPATKGDPLLLGWVDAGEHPRSVRVPSANFAYQSILCHLLVEA